MPSTTVITINSLYNNGEFLSLDEMRGTLGIRMEELGHRNLKSLIESNLGPDLCYKPRRNQDQQMRDPFRTNLRELYLKDLKGSKVF